MSSIYNMQQPSCRDLYSCRCIDDIDSIRKHVFIELTSKCNFKCDFCVYPHSKRRKEFISMEFLREILENLEEVGPIEYIMFSQGGEPLLHPDFHEACRMVKKYGHKLIVTTNGSMLNNGIAKLPIDELYISLQTITKRSFEIRNSGLQFSDWLDKICSFSRRVKFYTVLYLFKENKFEYPSYVDMINVKDINRTIKLIKDIGKKINPLFRLNVNENNNFPDFIRILPNVYFNLKELRSWQYTGAIPAHLRLMENKHPILCCPSYKHHISILSNGDVTFCCCDYDGEETLGNVKDESLRSICQRKKRNVDLAQFLICRRCRGTLVMK